MENQQRNEKLIWDRFTLREALYLGFCAVFIVILRGVFRLHLNIPGHIMLFTMFFLLLGRGTVSKAGAATLVGLIAGLLCMMLGIGKTGPLEILKFVVPGMIVDLGGALYPLLPTSTLACVIVGAIASASRFVMIFLVEWMVGMEQELVLAHAAFLTGMNVVFGMLGSFPIPSIVRRLKANRLIP